MLVNDAESLNYYWLAIVIAALVGLFFGVAKRLLNPDNRAAMRHVGVNFIVGILLVTLYTTMTGRIQIQSERDGSVADAVLIGTDAGRELRARAGTDFFRPA